MPLKGTSPTDAAAPRRPGPHSQTGVASPRPPCCRLRTRPATAPSRATVARAMSDKLVGEAAANVAGGAETYHNVRTLLR